MNVHELPMITFTVLAQMSVGAFIVLGVINVVARLRGYSTGVLDEISDPAAYAIGATLVLGLGASMLHMNDPLNVLNVFRHVQTSWLSREIVTGMAFAGCGFVYAACQFRKWGSAGMRQGLAVLTALVGCVFVWSMSMVYYTLVTVPAWHTWITPARFFTTALILGAFAIGTAFMTVVMLRLRGGAVGGRLGAKTYSPEARSLILSSLRGIAVLAVVLLAVEFILQPMHLQNLMAAGQIGVDSAHAFSGGLAVVRIVLVCVGAGLLALFLFHIASSQKAPPRIVAVLVTAAFACVLISEFIGRASFYEQMTRIGM